jgi:phosphoribosylformylglycinamidine synthase
MTIYFYNFYTLKLNSENFYSYLISSEHDLNNKQITIISALLNNNPNERILIKNEIDIMNINLNKYVIIGPKMYMKSVFDSNFINILSKVSNIFNDNVIKRVERFHLIPKNTFKKDEFDMMVYEIYDKVPEIFLDYTIENTSLYPKVEFVMDLKGYNDKYNLGFDDQDIKNYNNYYDNVIKRCPTNIELFDLAQSNSEHSRHWFFNAKLTINGIEEKKTLFDYIKKPLKDNSTDSLVAFSDNSSVIKGYTCLYMKVNNENKYEFIETRWNPLLTAETHNFPTGIAPFEGATTGIGGRLRDVYATGRGGLMIAGTAGYSVGNLFLPNYELEYEKTDKHNLPGWKILIEASNGASDYGNKIGEPIILGFTRNYGNVVKYEDTEQHYEWYKPIMYTGGIGMVNSNHLYKKNVEKGMLIIRAGGPVFRLGLGGGAASSSNQDTSKSQQNAVQRGNPEMENRLYKFLRKAIEKIESNPIMVIHDQGAGGPANVTKEIIDNLGGYVDLKNLNLGDPTLSSLEKWVSEFQESVTFLIYSEDLLTIENLGLQETVNIEVFGKVTDTKHLELVDSSFNVKNLNSNGLIDKDRNTILDFDLEKISSIKQKEYKFVKEERKVKKIDKKSMIYSQKLEDIIKRVFSLLSVGSKRFLVNKVDRSVTGLVVQQQTCGYSQLPVSDYGLTLFSLLDTKGIATSIGEQPIKSLIDVKKSIGLSIGEMLTNLMFVKIKNFEGIKCSGNWMAAPKLDNDGYEFYEGVKTVSEMLSKIGIAIDGGKDSLSMATRKDDKYVKSPLTFVLSSYASVPNVFYRTTPDLKVIGNYILFVDLGFDKCRMGGSSLYQTYNELGDEAPGPDNEELLKIRKVFEIIQKNLVNIYQKTKIIYAGHDRSDGGLITSILEMAFSGNKGVNINIPDEYLKKNYYDIMDFLFNEELGIVLEVNSKNYQNLCEELMEYAPTYIIGEVTKKSEIVIGDKNNIYMQQPMHKMRSYWEATSYALEEKQTPKKIVIEERYNTYIRNEVPYSSDNYQNNPIIKDLKLRKPKAGIIREVGSNGEREMATAFYMAGFDVFDINTNLLMKYPKILNEMEVIAFVGGFSYSDTLGSANGWASVLNNNNEIMKELLLFRRNKNKYALGICNGFQLLTLLGWFDDILEKFNQNENKYKIRILENNSERFESRFVNVKIMNNNSYFLKENIGDILGVWSAHGEGRVSILEKNIENESMCKNLLEYSPIRYIDDQQQSTVKYPFNPNGSYEGIASLISKDKRILGMMPHCERSFLKSQWPVIPNTLFANNYHTYTPWFSIFTTIRDMIISMDYT